jgi:hypothetical protein
MMDKLGDQVCERDLTFLNRVLVITLHLACLLTRETGEKGSEEHFALHKELYELIRINAKGRQVSVINLSTIKIKGGKTVFDTFFYLSLASVTSMFLGSRCTAIGS